MNHDGVSSLLQPATPNIPPPVDAASAAATGNVSDDGLVAVSRKTHGVSGLSTSSQNTKQKTPIIWIINSSSLFVDAKCVKPKAVFVSRFSPDITSKDRKFPERATLSHIFSLY